MEETCTAVCCAQKLYIGGRSDRGGCLAREGLSPKEHQEITPSVIVFTLREPKAQLKETWKYFLSHLNKKISSRSEYLQDNIPQ